MCKNAHPARERPPPHPPHHVPPVPTQAKLRPCPPCRGDAWGLVGYPHGVEGWAWAGAVLCLDHEPERGHMPLGQAGKRPIKALPYHGTQTQAGVCAASPHVCRLPTWEITYLLKCVQTPNQPSGLRADLSSSPIVAPTAPAETVRPCSAPRVPALRLCGGGGGGVGGSSSQCVLCHGFHVSVLLAGGFTVKWPQGSGRVPLVQGD